MVKQLLTVLPYPLSHLTRVLISSAADFIYLLIQMNKCPAPPAGKQSLHFLYPPLRIRPNGRRHYIALYIMYIAYAILHFALIKLLHFVCVLVKMTVPAMPESNANRHRH